MDLKSKVIQKEKKTKKVYFLNNIFYKLSNWKLKMKN